MKTNTPICLILIMGLAACGNNQHAGQTQGTIKLVTVAPGHFHASLVQKSAYPGVSDTAYV